MKNDYNLQDTFLNEARKENIIVTVFLVNGFQIRGFVKSFDSFTVLVTVDQDQKQNLIYKHAISTIVPFKDVSIFKQ